MSRITAWNFAVLYRVELRAYQAVTSGYGWLDEDTSPRPAFTEGAQAVRSLPEWEHAQVPSRKQERFADPAFQTNDLGV
jgi:hypothetical protein